jgi:Tfp pilus assembly protein PilX
MNKQPNPDRSLLHFLLRAQQIAQQDGRSDRGYAMLIVSLVSIAMFSMLAAYMTMTNLSKSSTNAYVDGTNTFYAAESGLNKRVQQVREKFVNYTTPTGNQVGGTTSVISSATISNCFTVAPGRTATSDDFECRNFSFRYNNNLAASKTSQGETVISEQNDNQNSVNYVAYTFVADNTKYTDTAKKVPPTITLSSDLPYAGLKAQEYQYTVYATANANQNVASGITQEEIAAKAREGGTGALAGDTALIASYNTKLAAANSANASRATSNTNTNTVLEMNFKSRIIPLFQFAVFYDDDLEMNSTSRMDITGRVHTNKNFYLQPTQTYAGTSDTASGTFFTENITVAGNIYNRVDASTATTAGMPRIKTGGTVAAPTYTDLTPRRAQTRTPTSLSATARLAPTELTGFGGKVKDGNGGAVVLNPPEASFLRKQNKAGTIGEYYGKADIRLEMVPDRTAVPFKFTTIQTGTSARGTTCATSLKVSTERGEYSSVKCNEFTEGQLRSLMQPVLVMPSSVEEATRFCGITTWTAPSPADKKKLQALALAVSASPTPVSLNALKTSSPTDVANNLTALIESITGFPDVFARSKGSCFLAAPIQRLATEAGSVTAPTVTSTYYDRREARWLTMLQTNIQSLTVWNRDGVFATFNENLNDRDTAINLPDSWTKLQASATDVLVSANNLVFVRAAADTTDTTLSQGSFQRLGLAAADRTEGGLVYHAIVSDDLKGDGTSMVTYDSTKPIYNKKGEVIADKRTYPGITDVNKSPYGFAFSGGINLPGPLTIATDQGVYMQGDYNYCMDNCQNTNVATAAATTNIVKLPASILADTITVLSNNCQDGDNKLNCGITTGANQAVTTRMNAAFLSYTDKSVGNVDPTTDALPTLPTGVTKRYSGGLNNYMRMTEDWYVVGTPAATPVSIPFVYRGSFVSLGAALEFSGEYKGGCGVTATPTSTTTCYYNIPQRDFGFDEDFNQFSKLPPLSPRAVYLQQDVFKRSYN